MDAERRDEALTASALDGEIRAALDVDPSPEFLARVRTGIASEPRQAAWRWPWMFAAAGAMATLIAIAIVVSGPHEVSSVLPADRMPLQARTVAPFSQIVPVASGFSRTERSAEAFALQPREPARSVHAAGRQPREPEVLIDPRESMALRRLIAGTREGTLDLSAALQATTPTTMDLPPLSEIAIPVITIDPITPEAGDEGARQ
ncbi:MAG: hypothetical protein DMF94_33635 [Acidobacteria bacterium]|nr:MAG: hypothetical protein DMF94_33635 [Acidobacteriota bacterium]